MRIQQRELYHLYCLFFISVPRRLRGVFHPFWISRTTCIYKCIQYNRKHSQEKNLPKYFAQQCPTHSKSRLPNRLNS